MADFYWVGNTAASVNSFRFDVLTNWRQIQGTTLPGGSPRWVVPSRLPIGNDNCFVGQPQIYPSSSYPGPYHILSPLLYGGVTGTSLRSWPGVTSGSSRGFRHGPATLVIFPTYPFRSVGFGMDITILNQWRDAVNKFGTTSGYYMSSPFTSVGETLPYYDNAVFATAVSGVTVEFMKPTDFWGVYGLRWMGQVWDYSATHTNPNDTAIYASHASKLISIHGYTAGVTQSSGATASYDGSMNVFHWESGQPQFTWNSTTKGPAYASGASLGWGTYWTVPVADIGNSPTKGGAYLFGSWNDVRNRSYGHRYGFINIGATCNRIWIAPQSSMISTAPINGNQYLQVQPNGISGASGASIVQSTAECSVFMNPFSNTKMLIVGDHSKGVLRTCYLNILGDVTPSSGFNTFTQPYGGLTGTSAGYSIPVTTTGHAFLFPTVNKSASAKISMDYPDSTIYDTWATTITNLNVVSNNNQEMDVEIVGKTNITNTKMDGGIISLGSSINPEDSVNVTNLVLGGQAVLDLSKAPTHKGLQTTIDFDSTEARVIPNPSLKLTTNSKVLISKASVTDPFITVVD